MSARSMPFFHDWIYEHSHNNTMRYVLGQPDQNGRNLICFGINPSTATPEKLDNTLTTVSQIAKKKNYDGWVMLNLYPQRATNPNDMHMVIDQDAHDSNKFHILNVLDAYTGDLWAGWGTLIKKRPYLAQCLRDISDSALSRTWVTIGRRSIDGHPHHPLYLNHSCEFEVFSIGDYIKSL